MGDGRPMQGSDTDALPALPPGCTARPATLDDAAAVAALRSACQADEGDPWIISAEEQRGDWDGQDLDESSVVIVARDGSIVAEADIINRANVLVSVYGCVHPDQRGRGLGTYLVRWGETRTRAYMSLAPADAQIAAQHYINVNNPRARALMDALGYHNVRTIYVMQVDFAAAPPAATPIDGIRIRPFVPGQDEHAFFETIEDAFRDLWGRPPGNFEHWMEDSRSEREHPHLWHLAEDGTSGEVVGVCRTRLLDQARGWIASLGVRRPWRRRGVALALLQSSFDALYRDGARSIQLSVDAASPTDAPQLYTRAGMRIDQHILLYRKQLRPGKDYTTLASEA